MAPRDGDDIRRRGAVLLSALVLTDDDGLTRFRERRVADKRVTDEQLMQARTVLHAVSYALQGDSRDNWKRIDEAYRILRRNEPPKAPAEAIPTTPERPATPEVREVATRPPPTTPAVREVRAPAERAVAEPLPAPPVMHSHLSTPASPSPWAQVVPPSASTASKVPMAPPPSQLDASLDETSELDAAIFAHLAAPTPFRGEAAPPPSASVAEPNDLPGETAAFDPAMFAHLSDPTPFEAPAPERDEMGETAALDPAMFAHLVDPMPFQEGSAVLPSSAVDRSEGSELAGGTATIDPASIAGVVAAYPVRTAPLPMPVENYAALVARSEGASEAELAELHRAYGVADAAHRQRIDQEFSEAFARDATLRQQFVEHLRQGRDWLRRQRGGT